MLYETDVIEAVCQHIEARGYSIRQKLNTTQHGIDVIASSAAPRSLELCVEAKGETSQRNGSERFGKPFDSAQVKVHVAEAFSTGAELRFAKGASDSRRVALAFPKTALHLRYVASIEAAFTVLQLGVFWVAADRTVALVAPWSL